MDPATARRSCLGGCVGFPSGGVTTTVKVFETCEQVQTGNAEIDMMINLGQLLSGRVDVGRGEIRAVVATAAPRPVKVILECHYLNADQIRTACDLCIQAAAHFVKTGTGWAPTGATLDNISLIKAHVGDAIAIKAAGGVPTWKLCWQCARQEHADSG